MPALRRSRRHIAVLLGLLLTFVVGEPLRAHDCAMHLGVRAAAAGESHTGAVGSQEHQQHHQVGDFVPEAAEHAETHGGDHGQHSCQCLGTCCTVAAVRLPSLPALAVSLARPAEPHVPGFLISAPAPLAPRLLPFANGPPSPVA